MYEYGNPYYNNQFTRPIIGNNLNNSSFVAVSGELEARNYPVAYGNSVTFKDENNPYIYTKTSFSQMESPVFKKYRLVEEVSDSAVKPDSTLKGIDLSAFVVKEELKALQDELRALKKSLGEGDSK